MAIMDRDGISKKSLPQAMPGPRRLVSALLRLWRQYRTLCMLAELEPHQLGDIGLTAGDLRDAADALKAGHALPLLDRRRYAHALRDVSP